MSLSEVYRHTLAVRITHWTNAICLLVLLMSGLQIFNAHAALYWGNISHFETPILSMRAVATPTGRAGITTVAGHTFETTGVLGLSRATRWPSTSCASRSPTPWGASAVARPVLGGRRL